MASRLNDWNEVYNHKGIMKGITKQAARYVSLSHISKQAAVASRLNASLSRRLGTGVKT